MKTLNLARIAAIALVAAVAMPVSANISSGKVVQDVYSAVGSDGQVSMTIRNGVATLTGYANNPGVAQKAVKIALADNSVDKVINLISAQ